VAHRGAGRVGRSGCSGSCGCYVGEQDRPRAGPGGGDIVDVVSDDLELLTAWRAGERAAGEALLARHFDAVCRFFHNKVGDDAPDLIQQTFLALCEGRERFRGEAGFRSYVLGVARNVLLAHFRRKRKQAERFDPLEHSVADQQTSFTTEMAVAARSRSCCRRCAACRSSCRSCSSCITSRA
jgi:hypothetical protein